MAKTKNKAASPTSVTVRYDLHGLPTAQHKAGLAGLLLQAESMRDRKKPTPSIPMLTVENATTLTAVFTPESLTGLFDDLYDARLAEVESPTKWANAKLLRQIEKPDKTGKPKPFFVYEVVEPQGHFFRRYTDGKEAWHKLWRNMLWDIPRGKPTTRGPYNARAANASSGEGEAAWNELLSLAAAANNGNIPTCEIGSALLIGAQAKNAESVPFRDRVDHALLLHFWPLTTRIFVPEQINLDNEREFVGYVLAIPEVADLSLFTDEYKRWLGTLDPKPNGYRPAAAVVSLPAEGALGFMDGLANITATTITESDYRLVARALVGVEFVHLDKRGNNVKATTHGRLATDPKMLRQYRSITTLCRNPLFRAGRLTALVRGEAWHAAFDTMLADRPAEQFVKTAKTSRWIASFAWDALAQFTAIIASEQRRKDNDMANDAPPAPASLETIVFRLVQNYVRRKTEQKSDIKYESFKDNKTPDARGRLRTNYPQKYTDAQERVCEDLFLGLRSRRDDDFVSYFTGTLGSVPQRGAMPDEPNFAVIATALLDNEGRNKVKTLAMLAASAASYNSAGRDEAEDAEPKTEPKETK